MNERAELLLEDLLAEQQKTNKLLGMLIEALADEQVDDEQVATIYLDGTPKDS